MKVIVTPGKMTAAINKDRAKGNMIGLVPTLGYLHEGHEALIRKAGKETDVVVVSRFVNPMQFKPGAFRKYPRDLNRDLTICKNQKVDYVFNPDDKNMYPDGFDTSVEVKQLAERLEGSYIRWHYRAVTTIVAKLFNIVKPHCAYFGQKDPHQLALIKRFVRDLDYQVKIVGVPTKRGKDGVALSSRLSRLTPMERKAAMVIYDSMKNIESKILRGGVSRPALTSRLVSMIEMERRITVDYASIVDADTLREDDFGAKTLIYVVVFIGDIRLTDNIVVRTQKR